MIAGAAVGPQTCMLATTPLHVWLTHWMLLVHGCPSAMSVAHVGVCGVVIVSQYKPLSQMMPAVQDCPSCAGCAHVAGCMLKLQ
jgi:hypothetical protein